MNLSEKYFVVLNESFDIGRKFFDAVQTNYISKFFLGIRFDRVTF